MTVFEHPQFIKKTPLRRGIFNSLLGVWNFYQTRYFVFDIFRHSFSAKLKQVDNGSSLTSAVAGVTGVAHIIDSLVTRFCMVVHL